MTRALIALAVLLLASPALARAPSYARVKCLGLYCMIVDEPEGQLPPAPIRSDWNKRKRHFPAQCGR